MPNLRRWVLKASRCSAPLAPYLLLAVAVGLFVATPFVFHQHRYVSHGALKTRLNDVPQAEAPSTDHFSGQRNCGSTFWVLVIRNCPLGIAVLGRLAAGLHRAPYLRNDVAVVVASDLSTWSLPPSVEGAVIRGALFIDLCSNSSRVCLDTIGKDGLLPNLDVTSVVELSLRFRGFDVDVFCQTPSFFTECARLLTRNLPGWDQWLSPNAKGYFTSLLTLLNSCAVEAPHTSLRQQGIHSLTLRAGGHAFAPLSFDALVARLSSGLLAALRRFNALDGKLHRGYFLYYLTGAEFFIDNERTQLIALSAAAAVGMLVNYHLSPHVAGLILGVLWHFSVGLLAWYVHPAAGAMLCLPLWVTLRKHRHWRPSFATAVGCVNAAVLPLSVMLHPAVSLVGGICSAASVAALFPPQHRGFRWLVRSLALLTAAGAAFAAVPSFSCSSDRGFALQFWSFVTAPTVLALLACYIPCPKHQPAWNRPAVLLAA